jgi:hypothetical protein
VRVWGYRGYRGHRVYRFYIGVIWRLLRGV